MRLVVKEFDVGLIGDQFEKTIGIGLEDNYGMVFPSPITNFIKNEYANKGKALNTQKNAAYAVTRFINYLYKCLNNDYYIDLRTQGLKGLKLEHGAGYISELSLEVRCGKKGYEYVQSDIDYISKFYYWLKKQSITDEEYKLKERENTYSKYKKSKRMIQENVFEINEVDIIYPTDNSVKKSKIKTFGANRDNLIAKFINVAREVDSEIALGIILQILGGLRRSEVVNLKPSSFRWENKSLIIKVRDNQRELFPHVKSSDDVQVKNPRDQICLCSDSIKYLYDEHMNRLSKINAKKTDGIFISSNTKSTITGKTYSTRFEKVKEAFLNDLLLSGNHEDYLLLTSNAWSTHIGRGIFTNILLDLGLTATQVALARGDKNISSALHYVDEHIMLKSVNEAINDFRILL